MGRGWTIGPNTPCASLACHHPSVCSWRRPQPPVPTSPTRQRASWSGRSDSKHPRRRHRAGGDGRGMLAGNQKLLLPDTEGAGRSGWNDIKQPRRLHRAGGQRRLAAAEPKLGTGWSTAAAGTAAAATGSIGDSCRPARRRRGSGSDTERPHRHCSMGGGDDGLLRTSHLETPAPPFPPARRAAGRRGWSDIKHPPHRR